MVNNEGWLRDNCWGYYLEICVDDGETGAEVTGINEDKLDGINGRPVLYGDVLEVKYRSWSG